LAAQVIYPTVLAAWTFLAIVVTNLKAASLAAIIVFIVGFVGSFSLNLKAELDEE